MPHEFLRDRWCKLVNQPQAEAELEATGRVRFGEADEVTRRAIEAIQDIEVLEDLTVCLIEPSSWAELLA